MKPLPKSLSIPVLSSKTLPGDITIGEARKFIVGHIEDVRKMSSRPEAVRIRMLDSNGNPLPDDMSMREFRTLASAGKAFLCIDDGEGGIPVKEAV